MSRTHPPTAVSVTVTCLTTSVSYKVV